MSQQVLPWPAAGGSFKAGRPSYTRRWSVESTKAFMRFATRHSDRTRLDQETGSSSREATSPSDTAERYTKKNIGDERGKERQEGGREQTGVASVASADRPPSADTKTEERQDYGLVSGCSSERALADPGLHVRAAMVPRPCSSTRGAHAAL
jgi:hypothetical protein